MYVGQDLLPFLYNFIIILVLTILYIFRVLL